MNRRIELGRFGEDIAADLLQRKGFEIVARNWRCREGELDLIVRSSSVLAGVEVKTRRTLDYGGPLEAVTAGKAARLRHLLGRWLSENPQRRDVVRIDLVGIYCPRQGPAQVRHLVAVA